MTIAIEKSGKITLPNRLRKRYHLTTKVPLRIVETRSGILLVPLTDKPMGKALAREVAGWQALGMASWEKFPYEAKKA